MSGAIPKSDLTSAIVGHFAALKNQHAEVPEWAEEGKPCIIYFDPLNVQERIDLDENDPEFLIKVIVAKAKNADGLKRFTLADLPMLKLQASPLVIATLANRILNADAIDPRLLGESSPTGEKTEASVD